MSKVILVPVNNAGHLPFSYDTLCIKDAEEVTEFYTNMEAFVDIMRPAEGALFAFYSAHRYRVSYHDKDKPYGTVFIKGSYRLKFADYVILQNGKLKWLHNGDYQGHLLAEAEKKAEAEFMQFIIAHPKLQCFPEETRKFFYHENL